MCGAEMRKARDPKDRLWRGFTSWWEPDERRNNHYYAAPQYYVGAACCYRPSSMVCQSVCLLQSWALQKLLNRSKYRLGCGLRLAHSCIRWGPNPPCEGETLSRKGAAHCKVQGHSVMIFAKMTEPIELSYGMWTRVGPRKHILDRGVYWHNLVSTTEFHVRQQCVFFVKLLWPLFSIHIEGWMTDMLSLWTVSVWPTVMNINYTHISTPVTPLVLWHHQFSIIWKILICQFPKVLVTQLA